MLPLLLLQLLLLEQRLRNNATPVWNTAACICACAPVSVGMSELIPAPATVELLANVPLQYAKLKIQSHASLQIQVQVHFPCRQDQAQDQTRDWT